MELRTKRGVDCTKWFPEVAQLLAELPGGPHVIDGEACVLDEIGRSDFNRFDRRAKARGWYAGCDPVTLCAFDLLYLDGRSVMNLPLVTRKDMLRELLEPLGRRIISVGEFAADAALFNTIVIGTELEGFMAKKRDSVYQPGVKTRDWLKMRRAGWQEGRTWRK